MARKGDMCSRELHAGILSGNVGGGFTPFTDQRLFVANTVSCCQTLGPGKRGVIWVSGCSRKCPGCIATPIQDMHSGVNVSVEQLAEKILSWNDIEGVTLSGGEPFEQADALADLCYILRHERQLTIMSYSGFTLTELRESPDPGQRRLLYNLDILIDGPFIKSLQADLLWRGSRNQRVIFLRATYLDWAPSVDGPGEGVEIHISSEGTIYWVGIPEAGFIENLERALGQEGIKLVDIERLWL